MSSERKDIIDNQLDELLGITTNKDKGACPDPNTQIMKLHNKTLVPETIPEQPVVHEDEFKDRLETNLRDLNKIYNFGEEAIKTAIDQYTTYGKDRSAEVISQLIGSMLNVKKEIRDTLKDVYGGGNNGFPNSNGNNINNAVIFSGSFKELIGSIPEQRTVIIKEGVKEDFINIPYELSIKKIDLEKLSIYDPVIFKYEIVQIDDICKLIFKNSKDMNRLKYEIVDKLDKDMIL